MADKNTNVGGLQMVWAIKGFLQTVQGANKYRFNKAIDIDFDLSPAFEIRFDDDAEMDLVPNGDIGTWAASFPLTSDVVATTTGGSISTDDDKSTLTYWFYELFNKRFPPIEFNEQMVDNQASPDTMNLTFKGFLTTFRKVRTETEGVYTIELTGIMKPDSTADFIKT